MVYKLICHCSSVASFSPQTSSFVANSTSIPIILALKIPKMQIYYSKCLYGKIIHLLYLNMHVY